TRDPSATLSSSADFPVLPVIRPTQLPPFPVGTRRASPVAGCVLVAVLSLTTPPGGGSASIGSYPGGSNSRWTHQPFLDAQLYRDRYAEERSDGYGDYRTDDDPGAAAPPEPAPPPCVVPGLPPPWRALPPPA